MGKPIMRRLLRPFCQIQDSEIFTTLLMFAYSFMAMTSYNIIQPIQRSLFIEKLGANQIPYVQLAAGIVIGVTMTGYTWLISRLPRRWSLPITQAGIAVLLAAFWFLFQLDSKVVAVAFYITGLILGILLISQFWTLANVVYVPRQAKRLFGFIGSGASLGGTLGAVLAWFSGQVGTINLLLVSAGFMLVCMVVVILIIRREGVGNDAPLQLTIKETKKGVGARKALELLRTSKHLRLIAVIISFGAIGAAIIDQQLNMATELFKSQGGKDAMTAFLGQVRAYTSIIGFIIQIALTSRIHRNLGVGFALLLLPIGLGTTATVILLNAALWAPAMARIFDQCLRYTVDKTTREILYMPLPDEIKYEAKPFVDVTLDRFAKGMTGVVLLILISPWGLHLDWQKISYASLAVTVVWLIMAVRARHGYQTAFRQSIQSREISPAGVRLEVADLSTIETLVEELSSPDERKVLYAIDMLESLEKRSLITPLLLYHESPAIRVRALGLVSGILPNDAARWLPPIQRMMADASPEVRAAAVAALANLQDEQVTSLVRPYLNDDNPRIVMTAAMVLSGSSQEPDAAEAEEVLTRLLFDTGDSAAQVRREFAMAVRHIPRPRFRHLLIPLLHDPKIEVAEEAMRTVQHLGIADFIFVPTLISLLRNRRLKSRSRDMLVAAGEPVLNILNHFLRDPDEDIWVRRAIPGTLARIPSQQSMDILGGALEERDGFLRFQVLKAIEKLHHADPRLKFNREFIETQALQEGSRYQNYRLASRRLFQQGKLPADSLLFHALADKTGRTMDRMYRFLGLLYPWKDIAASRWAIEHGDPRSRSAALEYLDNLLGGSLRKRLVPVLEEASGDGIPDGPGTPAGLPRESVEQTVLRLIHDADPVLSAAAVLFTSQAQLKGLEHELEDILATRDARDWCVFEAASWVLATLHFQDTKHRAMWIEPLPTAEIAERLRRFPLFASVSVDGLFRIAEAGSQLRCEPGRVLCQDGSLPESLHLLLDGRVSCKAITGKVREVEAPAAVGFLEVLEGRLMKETVRTVDGAVCLDLSGESFSALLADDLELVQGLFRMSYQAEGPAGLVSKGVWRPERAAGVHAGLTPAEEMLILKNIKVFSELDAEEVAGLASIVSEIRLEAGSVLFGEADPPALYVLLSGEISLESSSGEPALEAGPHDYVGLDQILAGVGLQRKARVVSSGSALHIDRDDLFDLMAQRPDLLRQLFSTVSRARDIHGVVTP